MKKLEDYIIYKQMLSNPNTPNGFYGLDSKVRDLHKQLIELFDDIFDGKLIVERLNWILNNINRVLSNRKGLDFFTSNAQDIADDLYYWIVNNARVRMWLTRKEIKRPEWFFEK